MALWPLTSKPVVCSEENFAADVLAAEVRQFRELWQIRNHLEVQKNFAIKKVKFRARAEVSRSMSACVAIGNVKMQLDKQSGLLNKSLRRKNKTTKTSTARHVCAYVYIHIRFHRRLEKYLHHERQICILLTCEIEDKQYVCICFLNKEFLLPHTWRPFFECLFFQ
jgi:hypothetical protein